MKKGQIDRVPPHNLEAEQAVLGALFIDEKAIIKISEILVPEDFYRSAHQKIYQAMLTLYNQNMPIDIVAVYIKDILEDIGTITGEFVTEDIINEIFSKFCLGK